MRIPGEKRSPYPDECGNRAGAFAEAVRLGDMDEAWSLLSKETRGMRMGVWATKNRVDMQQAYRAGYDARHPMRASMLDDFRNTVLSLWPLEDLTDLGISPTSYVDDRHAFAFLPFGMNEDTTEVTRGRAMNGLILPMLLEDEEWRVDLPGWRFWKSRSQSNRWSGERTETGQAPTGRRRGLIPRRPASSAAGSPIVSPNITWCPVPGRQVRAQGNAVPHLPPAASRHVFGNDVSAGIELNRDAARQPGGFQLPEVGAPPKGAHQLQGAPGQQPPLASGLLLP